MFSGKLKDWNCWKIRFLAIAAKLKFRDILLGRVQVPTDECKKLEEDEEILKVHDEGFIELLLSMKDPRCVMLVSESLSKDHPLGDLVLDWTKLNDLYSPKDLATKLDLQDEIRNSKMESGSDPAEWFEKFKNKVSRLKVDFGVTFEDEELIHTVLKNFPDEYDDLKLNFFRQRSSKVDPLTFESMVNQICDYHKYSNKVNNLKFKDLALTTVDKPYQNTR